MRVSEWASVVRITKHRRDHVSVVSRTGAWRPGTPANSPGLPSWSGWVCVRAGPPAVFPWRAETQENALV